MKKTRILVVDDDPKIRRLVAAHMTQSGFNVELKDKPIKPESVQRYLESKFGENLAAVKDAMEELAASYDQASLSKKAYSLYERFRPSIPKGRAGWGAKGNLDTSLIRSLGGG